MITRIRNAKSNDLPSILALARRWPTHFVEAGIKEIESDFYRYDAAVATFGNACVGFVIWRKDPTSLEILWLAVDPDQTRNGIGARLMHEAVRHAGRGDQVYLKSASIDSFIPDSGFDASCYAGTHKFFEVSGFVPGEILRGYWSPTNHAHLWRKRA